MVHVPYKGAVPAMTDVIAGRVDLMIISMITGMPMVKNGSLRVLGVTQADRSPLAPEIPTIAESGLPGFDIGGSFLAMVPGATPQPIINKLHEGVLKVLAMPDVRSHLIAGGASPIGNSPGEAQRLLHADIARWAPVIKRLDLKAN